MAQGTREIQYAAVTNNGVSGTIYSAAENYGQLKTENAAIGGLAAGMSALVRDGSNEYKLTGDNSQLPTGNFKLYFTNSKNDSGRNR